MALEQFYGRIVDLVRRNDGDELTAAAGIADTVLHVGDTADFDETGGTVEINGDRYTYETVDHAANTLTLTSGLLVAGAVRDRVDVVDEELDEVVVEYVANILMEDQDPGDQPIEVTVNHGLVNYLAEQVRGGYAESVTLIRDGDDDLVIWQVNGKLVVDIALETVKTDVNVELAALNADLDELNTVTLPGVQSDLNTLNTVTIPGIQSDLDANEAQVATLNGKFPITTTSISDGAITTPKMTANSINGDRITANTLNADKIVAGSITGDKIQGNTISGDKIVANTITGDKIAANTIGADRIVANSIGADRLAANSVTAGKIQANAIDGMTITGVTMNSATVNGGSFQLGGAGITGPNGTWLQNDGDVLVGQTLQVTGQCSVGGGALITGETHSSIGFHDDGLAGGGLTAASIGNGGRIVRTSSSMRYKKFISDAAVDTDAVLRLQPRRFKRLALDQGNDTRWYLGLIAEEVEATGLTDLVFYDAAGEVDGVHYDTALTTALLALCQAQQTQMDAQQAQIDDLTARLDAAGL